MSWTARYGTEPPENLPEIGSFLEHRSVRRYSEQDVSEETISGLMAAAQSASTSSNLQLWSAISIQDPEGRQEIARLCADQRQVQDAPWFFAFLADHHRLRSAAARAGEAAEGLGYTEYLLMATIDASLAAERMVCAAESIGLGVCYIGALRNDPVGVQKALNLPEGVFGLFGLCIGFPAGRSQVKPRLSQDSIWFRERYDSRPKTFEYDQRMKEFYEREGTAGNHSWSARSGRRVDRNHLTGREILKDWLEKIGMGRE